MAIVVIALKDIMVEPNIPVDLTMLPEEEAIALIKKSYGFLSPEVDVTIKGDIAVINFPEEKAKKVDEALKFYERGVRKAERGEYKAAIELFKKTLDYLPAHSDARRNIAMAYLESGNKEEAKNQLIDVLRLNPKDTWGYVLLGNVYSKYENDFDSAEPFYKKAYELNPDDPYVLTNYATLELERGQTEQARELFLRAIEKDPTYPNARFGLAMLFEKEQKLDQALSSLDQLIAQPVSPDPRSEPVYQHARALYLKICQTMAQRSYALMMELVENARTAVERGGGGYPIEMIEDNSLQRVSARTEMAWKHNRPFHRIVYRNLDKAVTPHLIVHELEHISLESDARKVGRNRIFLSTSESRELAIRSIRDDVFRLQNLVHSEDSITSVVLELVHGLTNQLLNCPLDMVIEDRLSRKYAKLMPIQFYSLSRTQFENLTVFTNKEIKRLTPSKIYHANIAMNCAYAIFTDWLFKGKTEYTKAYKQSSQFSTGQKLFHTFLEMEKSFSPGDEYLLVEQFARTLKLEGWYSLRNDETATAVGKPQGPTNPELLKSLEPAAVMHCLDALQRFTRMEDAQVKDIAFEIGLLGIHGIDYTKADTRYSLKSIPGEKFSGLQLLCLMYVGFQRIDPTLNTGLDFKNAYDLALKMYSKET